MLEALRFVQGAVAKKDFVAALTHFRIKDRTIVGANGNMALSSPIDLGLDIMPKAGQFIKALQTCQETISMHLTAGGRLSIKSGRFKALVDCIPDGFPDTTPAGIFVELPDGILPALKALSSFIAEDASRPWARGILLRGSSAYATNNVVLMEYWLKTPFPVAINIPRSAVTELLRIGVEPARLQVCQDSVTFHYEGGQWLKTQLYSTEWPDLNRIFKPVPNAAPVPPSLWDALEDLRPFTGKLNQVYLSVGKVSTGPDDDEASATSEVPGITAEGVFNLDYLLRLKGFAEKIDLASYPSPCMFFGDNLRGAIIGMRA